MFKRFRKKVKYACYQLQNYITDGVALLVFSLCCVAMLTKNLMF